MVAGFVDKALHLLVLGSLLAIAHFQKVLADLLILKKVFFFRAEKLRVHHHQLTVKHLLLHLNLNRLRTEALLAATSRRHIRLRTRLHTENYIC